MVKKTISIHTSLDNKSYEYLLYLKEINNLKYLNEPIKLLIDQHKQYNNKIRKNILNAVIDKVLKYYFEDKNGKTKR